MERVKKNEIGIEETLADEHATLNEEGLSIFRKTNQSTKHDLIERNR